MTVIDVPRLAGFLALLAALSAVVVWSMTWLGVVDHPGTRSSHKRPTPKGGGVGLVVAVLAGVMALARAGGWPAADTIVLRGLLGAGSALALVAYLDDLRDFSFAVKLGAQILTASVVIALGLRLDVVNLPGAGAVALGWWGVVATLLWIVFVTNAMNFIDGLNGLAAGVALIACAVLAILAARVGQLVVFYISVFLAAGLLGFLPFNYPRARIFMGDVGSQFCGFLLAGLGVAASQSSGAVLSLVVVPMLLFGVLFDVAFTLIRRLLMRVRVTLAHRTHLYQLANRSGVPAWAISIVHWAFALWGAMCCAQFIAADTGARPWVILLVLPPQLIWLGVVIALMRRAGLVRWGEIIH